MSRVSGVSNAALGQDQFLQLLVAQLRNQDPLNPTSSTEFISQLATFTQVEQATQLNASFAESLKLQQLTQGASLVGKTVTYASDTGTATGVVGSLAVENGAYVLKVGDTSVALSQITNVS